MRQAADQPAGNDHSGEQVKSVVLPPVAEVASSSAAAVEALEPSEEETRGELTDIQNDIDMHFEPGAESSTTQGEKRKKEKTPMLEPSAPSMTDEDLPRVPPVPVTWTPQGEDDALNRKDLRAQLPKLKMKIYSRQRCTLEKEF